MNEYFHQEKSRDFTLSIEVLRAVVSKGIQSAFYMQTLLRCYHDGKIHKDKFITLAEGMGKSREYVAGRINECVRLGLVEKRKNGWYFVIGAKRWNYVNGYMHSKMVGIPVQALYDLHNFRIFIRSVMFHFCEVKALNRQKQLRELPVNRATKLSISYLSNFTGLSERTISRHKKAGYNLGFHRFQREYIILDRGDFRKAAVWKEYKDAKHQILQMASGEFVLVFDDVSTFFGNLQIKRTKHKWTEREKAEIRHLYDRLGNANKTFLKKAKDKFRGRLVLTAADVEAIQNQSKTTLSNYSKAKQH